ncbi:hypothetical protein P5G65_09135 [Paenibacillus chondroitinus]|uniref:Uncharacterized protein n=1 Tax=Paenibacillus chondroitinus TaxID=59842 RepID=A0ABU6D8I1_9BACL|nr:MULTISPECIES: hypothetical protein [Paenibacillus]MCY9659762.1 hypothetical protein [Paenibacillus anseongense]MEB4794059.1 hypothetical protein [Paenibacillus chondroitinus]
MNRNSYSLAGRGVCFCEDLNIAVTVPGDSTKGYGVRPWAIDPEYATKLWQISEKLTGTNSNVSDRRMK